VLRSGPVLRRLLELQRDGRAKIIICEKPRKSDLPAWIRTRAKFRQVRLDVTAVADLAEFVAMTCAIGSGVDQAGRLRRWGQNGQQH